MKGKKEIKKEAKKETKKVGKKETKKREEAPKAAKKVITTKKELSHKSPLIKEESARGKKIQTAEGWRRCMERKRGREKEE